MREYNPAYDLFLFRYFRENGMDVDDGIALEKANSLSLALERKGAGMLKEKSLTRAVFSFRENLDPHERLFWDYVHSWRSHPEVRPSEYSFLDRILDGKGRPEIDGMRILESQLPPDRGRLLLSRDEVATEVCKFYKDQFGDALRRDLDRGAAGNELRNYFESEELDLVRNSLASDSLAGRGVAEKILVWLEKTAPANVLKDLDSILEEHYGSPEHMQPRSLLVMKDKNSFKACEHKSEYLKLTVYRSSDGVSTSVFLIPVRGYLSIKEGWQDVLFPWYHVKELQE